MEYRLAYCGYGEVNWCEALGTVLANDEVINGGKERGGHPVVNQNYANGICVLQHMPIVCSRASERIEFSDAMKENAEQLDRQELWSGD